MKITKLVFATNNEHKLEEVRAKLGKWFQIVSLKDIEENIDIPETGSTLEENAMLKAEYIWKKYGYNCIADDTGLEVKVLNNAPGVYSARYAGEHKDSNDNVNKLLDKLKNKDNRIARFRTVIALIMDGKRYLFEGSINGTISRDRKGNSGFGYDPVFIADGHKETFAEIDLVEKNKISHRAKALEQLILFLRKK